MATAPRGPGEGVALERAKLVRRIWSLRIVRLMFVGLGTLAVADPADIVPRAERASHLTTMKTRVEEPATVTPMTIAEVFALPRPPSGVYAEPIRRD